MTLVPKPQLDKRRRGWKTALTPDHIAVWDKYIKLIAGAGDRLYHRLTAMAKEECVEAVWQEHIENVGTIGNQMRLEIAEANSAFLAAHKRGN